MTSWLAKSFDSPRKIAGLVVLLLLGLVWWSGIFDNTPSKKDAEAFIAWGLRMQSDGITALADDGTEVNIKKADFGAIESVECRRVAHQAGWFSGRSSRGGFPRHTCFYRLRGAKSEGYWLAVGTTYFSRDTFQLANVGHYMLTFWAANPDQRRLLAERGIDLPKPTTGI